MNHPALAVLIWAAITVPFGTANAQAAPSDENARCIESAEARGASSEHAANGCRHIFAAEARYKGKRYLAAIAEYKQAYELLLEPKLPKIVRDIWIKNLSDRPEYIERALADITWCEQLLAGVATSHGDSAAELQALLAIKLELTERQGTAKAAAVALAAPSAPATVPSSVPEPRRLTALVVTSGAIGLATAATGLVFGGIAVDAKSDIRDQCRESSGHRICSPAVDALERRRSTFATASDVLLLSGTAIGITAIVMYFVDGAGTSAADQQSKVALEIQPRCGGAEVTLAGRF